MSVWLCTCFFVRGGMCACVRLSVCPVSGCLCECVRVCECVYVSKCVDVCVSV